MRRVQPREPSPEMKEKIHRAAAAVRGQRSREVVCPYCHKTKWVVYEDTRGHFKAKCHVCGEEVVLDPINMRRVRPVSIYAAAFSGPKIRSQSK